MFLRVLRTFSKLFLPHIAAVSYINFIPIVHYW